MTQQAHDAAEPKRYGFTFSKAEVEAGYTDASNRATYAALQTKFARRIAS